MNGKAEGTLLVYCCFSNCEIHFMTLTLCEHISFPWLNSPLSVLVSSPLLGIKVVYLFSYYQNMIISIGMQ